MNQTNTLGLAAQVAFWVFLALLPLAAVLGLVVARLALARSDIEASALSSLPAAARGLVSTELARVAAWNGGTVAPVAAITFVWLAAGGVQSIFDALELQVGRARPWWRKKLLAIATCVALSVGVAFIAGVAAGAARVIDLLKNHVLFSASPTLDPVWIVGKAITVFVVTVASMCALYRVGTPRDGHTPIPVLPGALFAVVFDAAAGWGYGVSLRVTGIGTGYQAGLAAIGVTMTSLYLLSLGVLAGASLNHALSPRLRVLPRGSTPRLGRAGETVPANRPSGGPGLARTDPARPVLQRPEGGSR